MIIFLLYWSGNNSCDVTGSVGSNPLPIIIGSIGATIFVLGFFMVMVVHLKVQGGANNMPYVDRDEYRQQMEEAKRLQQASRRYDGPPSDPPPRDYYPAGAGSYPYQPAPNDDPPQYAETE